MIIRATQISTRRRSRRCRSPLLEGARRAVCNWSRASALTFELVFLSTGLAQERSEVSVGDYSFDPAAGLPALPPGSPIGLIADEPGPGIEHWRIIQLNRLPDRATQMRLRDAYGLELRRYVQGGAYIERVTVERVRELEAAGLLRSSVLYHPLFKISRSIGQTTFVTPERRAISGLLLSAILFDRADITLTEQAIRNVSGASEVRVLDDRRYGGAGQIVFRVPSSDELAAVARIDGIARIEEVGEIIEDNGEAATILQSGVAGDDTIWSAGLAGTGQLVHVVEKKPPDFNHCFFTDPENDSPGPSHRKIAANLHPPDAIAGPHGTFIAASVLGDAVTPLGESGWHADRGGAWDARLVAGSNVDVGDEVSLLMVLSQGAANGAHIHTNSWHSAQDVITDNVNVFARTNESHLVIGSIANSTSGMTAPPATAKNALGVSAARKASPMQHGEGLPGPYDLRRKPDVVGVGCDVVSAKVGTTCETGVYDPFRLCSTSDATAHVAAAATLVRQYYSEGWYPSGAPRAVDRFTPSGALLKATLVNSARDMTGVPGYPSDKEGWGIITLDRTLSLADSPRHLQVWDVPNDDASALTTETAGAETNGHEYPLTLATSTEPLSVTLVWTDDSSHPALVNNLDLQVLDPNDQTFLGNHFTGGFSTSGGTSDNVNNVEQVLIENPAPGQWKLRVIASAVAIGPQGYALVATGRFGDEIARVPSAITTLIIR